MGDNPANRRFNPPPERKGQASTGQQVLAKAMPMKGNMVDSPQVPSRPPDKTTTEASDPQPPPLPHAQYFPAKIIDDPLAKLGMPALDAVVGRLCGYLPVFLVCCGILASAVLFLSGISLAHCSAGSYYGGMDSAGWNGFAHFFDNCVLCAGWCLVALAFFVGPLLIGIAGILHRLNQKKGG